MSTSEKLEYDSNAGGKIVLPDYIPTYRYAAEHLQEIKELLNNIRNPSNTKLIFQSLPKHMRRRAMSHHPKRLPRKYRNIHKIQQAKAGNPQQMKRPSRKYRRKPSNLMQEYVRRQRNHIWLETHIWHAKRFHMINRWGYKLPFASCDRTYRASYRASARHCLLQDISYYSCIEIKGEMEVIKSAFDRLTNNKSGLSITAKAYTSGKREGIVDLFKIDEYPRGALTRANFLWKSSENLIEINRILWIFIHPSGYKEVLEEFIKVFQLVSTRTIKTPLTSESGEEAMETDKEQKFIIKTSSYVRIPQYINEENGIVLTELKNTINRFRLTGDLSQAVLSNAFKIKQIENDDELKNSWFTESLQSEKCSASHKVQSEYWKTLSNFHRPSELPPKLVIGLNIEDPRINRPKKRTKAKQITTLSTIENSKIYYEVPENLSYSKIWDHDVREEITKGVMTNHEYCTMRNKNALVPGERCTFENGLQPLPILIIQRPGSKDNQYKRLGYDSGWDVISPSGYGMIIWLSLISWGAKPGGLREMISINRETGDENVFLPDSVSGRKFYLENYVELRDKYFRLPPNKRCNYNKLGISSPFRAPLQQLANEWASNKNLTDHKDFYVLRDRRILEVLINKMKSKIRNYDPNPLGENFDGNGCLIQISIKMKSRGNPGNFSIICLPTHRDIKRYYKLKHFKDNSPVYVEPLKKDENEVERKRLRIEHKKLLKRLRAKRVREKKKKQEKSEIKIKIRPAKTRNLVNQQFKKVSELWLKENPNSVRNQCTREVFGYVTNSQFCFTESKVTGIGYVTLNGFKEFLNNFHKNFEKIILIRSSKSQNYRFATIKINPMVII